jgi:hypothetical protein
MVSLRMNSGSPHSSTRTIEGARGRGKGAVDKRITNYNTTNQTTVLIFFGSFPYDTKVTSAINEMANQTWC